MIAEGVAVINTSLSFTFDGPGDGTSPSSRSPLNAVERAVASGLVWVTSAGNNARETWYGSYANSDRDRWVEFNGIGSERNYLRLPANEEVESFAVELRWEDNWGGATSNLDLFLFDGYTNELVASERDLQSGASGHYPIEYLRLKAAPSPGPIVDRYYVAVSHELGDAPEWIQLRIRFSENCKTLPETAALPVPRRAPVPACWLWAQPTGMTCAPSSPTVAGAPLPTAGSSPTSLGPPAGQPDCAPWTLPTAGSAAPARRRPMWLAWRPSCASGSRTIHRHRLPAT